MSEAQEVLTGRGAVQSPHWYQGPGVVIERTGPRRFLDAVHAGFDIERTMDRVVWLEKQYRAPGNDPYNEAMERLAEELRAAGFGDSARDWLELRTLETPEPVEVWTPNGASLTLLEADGRSTVLHAFEDAAEMDRTMLPIKAPAASVEAPVALSLEDLRPGDILVTEVVLRQVVRRAAARGAVAVVSASLGSYNIDPTGRKRHLDAVQYRQLRSVPPIPVCQISQRSFATIAAAAERGGARLKLEVDVTIDVRPIRTLVAVVRGLGREEEVMAISAHLHEPGANDNSSGVSTLMECAILLVEGIDAGNLMRPDRSIAFVWGDEFQQTEAFLDATERRVLAGISADMTGESLAETGAIALLERMPDPGALVTLPPDEHSAWGAGDVDEDMLNPNGLAVIARCAMLDVGLLEGAWESADHPWEGGSDHDVFLARGIPAVLFWHFTDFAYHTSLDRINLVDPTEMRRSGAAILITALAVADARAGDLDRYVRSLDVELDVRLAAANEVGDTRTAELWKTWMGGARSWLRVLCLGLEQDEAEEILGR